MSTIQIYKCDLCGAEQRSDKPPHWSEKIDGPAILDFSSVGNNQLKWKLEMLCYSCSHSLTDVIKKTIDSIKGEK